MSDILEQVLAANSRLEREIEAQRLTEAELLRIKNRLTEAQQLARIGSWEWEIAADTVHWSAELYRIYGLAPDQFKATYQGFLERVYPDDRATVEAVIAQALEQRREYRMVYRMVRPDGVVRQVESRGCVVTDEQGQAVRIYGTCQDVTDLTEATKALRDSEERFRATFDHAGTGIAHIAPDGTWVRVNRRLCDILGYSREELLQRNFQSVTAPEDLEANLELYNRAVVGDADSYTMEKRYVRKDGSLVWANLTVAVVRNAHRQVQYFVSVIEDISERKRAEEALQRAREEMQAMIDAVPGGVVWIDADLTYRGMNRHLARLLDMNPSQIIGQKVGFTNITPGFTKLVTGFFAGSENRGTGEIEMSLDNGVRTFLVMAEKYQQGQSAVFVGIDITERKQAESQLIHDVLHDRLTGLANRSLFMDRMTHAVNLARRHPGRLCAVLFFDFDRFKHINDTMGHGAGDELLIGAARRLEKCLRPEDTVARLGGDEFVILLDDIADISEAMLVAERVRDELSQPFTLRSDAGLMQQASVTVSIGIAHSNPAGIDPEQMLRHADIAMYRAKSRGRSCYELFDDAMHDQAMRRVRTVADLRRALDREEFELHYQPLVSLSTERLTGFEALVRWRHPERGLVFPADFIPLAEDMGLIVPLDAWVLRAACRQWVQWQQSEPLPGLRVGINCSSRFFYHPSFYHDIKRALMETGAEASGLMIETTERVLMQNPDDAIHILGQLRALGIRICLDDFGTGYTSLDYLQRLPIDILKIDRQFVDKMAGESRSRDLVHAMVVLASNLAIDVVAEGIETATQRSILGDLAPERELLGQGYLFSAAMNSEEATLLLHAG